ncbi:hypothetical protein NMG60_11000152 [Bertholletia excelsa]
MGLQDPHPFNFVDLRDKNLRVDTRTLILGVIFLVLLVISIFSFIYFIYVCIRRGQLSIVRPISHQPEASEEKPEKGLDKAAISSIPTAAYVGGVAECSICLGPFRDGEPVKVLPLCQHEFHSGCVDKWLQAKASCPLCRAAVVVRVDSLVRSDIP